MLALKPAVTLSPAPATSNEIEALTNEWRTSVTARLSASTADAYTHALDHYLRFLADVRLAPDAATIDDIAQYVAHCRAHCRDLTPHQRRGRPGGMAAPQVPCATMLRVRLTVLRSFYDTLMARGLCGANPLRGGIRLNRMARGEGVIRPTRPACAGWTLTREQAAALAAALDQSTARDRLLFALLLDTGLSTQAICALRLHDVAQRGQTLTVTCPSADTAAHDEKAAHAIVCSSVTAQLYRRYIRVRPAWGVSDALFLSQSRRNAGQGIGVSMVDKTLRSIGQVAGVVGVTARNLRHAHTQLHMLTHAPDSPMEGLNVGASLRCNALDTPCEQLLSALFARYPDKRADAEAPSAR